MTKTFKWCPEIAILKCLGFFQEPHTHICIRSVGAEIKTPECGNPALYLGFHDLGENCPFEYVDGLFNEAHARAIAEFVQHTPDEKLIVVNCEAGISRSAGVVLALRRFYGGDTEEVYNKAHPNIHVSSTLGRVLLARASSGSFNRRT